MQFHIHDYNYADGQKIAIKLSKRISKETASVKVLLREYNGVCNSPLKLDDSLTMAEALDPGTIEGHLSGLSRKYTSIATGNKHRIIDTYSMLCQSQEELVMLKKEVLLLVQYYEQRKKYVLVQLSNFPNQNNLFSQGAVAMLKQLLSDNDFYLKQGHLIIGAMNQGNTSIEAYSDSDFSDDNSDCSDSDVD